MSLCVSLSIHLKLKNLIFNQLWCAVTFYEIERQKCRGRTVKNEQLNHMTKVVVVVPFQIWFFFENIELKFELFLWENQEIRDQDRFRYQVKFCWFKNWDSFCSDCNNFNANLIKIVYSIIKCLEYSLGIYKKTEMLALQFIR